MSSPRDRKGSARHCIIDDIDPGKNAVDDGPQYRVIDAPRDCDRQRAPEADSRLCGGMNLIGHADLSFRLPERSPRSGKPVDCLERKYCECDPARGENDYSSHGYRDRAPTRLAHRHGLCEMPLEKRRVPNVGAKPDIEQIAKQWYCPYDGIEPKVQQHSGEDRRCHPEPRCRDNDVAGKSCSAEISQSRDETEK